MAVLLSSACCFAGRENGKEEGGVWAWDRGDWEGVVLNRLWVMVQWAVNSKRLKSNGDGERSQAWKKQTVNATRGSH